MRKELAGLAFGSLLVAATAAVGQTQAGKVAFDVASVRQWPPPDMQRMIADLQMGKKPE